MQSQPDDESSGEESEEHPCGYAEALLAKEEDHLVAQHLPERLHRCLHATETSTAGGATSYCSKGGVLITYLLPSRRAGLLAGHTARPQKSKERSSKKQQQRRNVCGFCSTRKVSKARSDP